MPGGRVNRSSPRIFKQRSRLSQEGCRAGRPTEKRANRIRATEEEDGGEGGVPRCGLRGGSRHGGGFPSDLSKGSSGERARPTPEDRRGALPHPRPITEAEDQTRRSTMGPAHPGGFDEPPPRNHVASCAATASPAGCRPPDSPEVGSSHDLAGGGKQRPAEEFTGGGAAYHPGASTARPLQIKKKRLVAKGARVRKGGSGGRCVQVRDQLTKHHRSTG